MAYFASVEACSDILSTKNVAIAISTDVYDRLDGVGKVGGIVGTHAPCFLTHGLPMHVVCTIHRCSSERVVSFHCRSRKLDNTLSNPPQAPSGRLGWISVLPVD